MSPISPITAAWISSTTSIDRATGTIRGRAHFANADGLFMPGMFARAEVPGSSPYQALMIPDAAIGTEQVRKFVYVLDRDNIARQRFVTLGPGGRRHPRDQGRPLR